MLLHSHFLLLILRPSFVLFPTWDRAIFNFGDEDGFRWIDIEDSESVVGVLDVFRTIRPQ